MYMYFTLSEGTLHFPLIKVGIWDYQQTIIYLCTCTCNLIKHLILPRSCIQYSFKSNIHNTCYPVVILTSLFMFFSVNITAYTWYQATTKLTCTTVVIFLSGHKTFEIILNKIRNKQFTLRLHTCLQCLCTTVCKSYSCYCIQNLHTSWSGATTILEYTLNCSR